MWREAGLLYLPSSFLVFLLASPISGDVQFHNASQLPNLNLTTLSWPYSLPPHVKYWPEDPPHRRRDLEVFENHIASGHVPIAVKKMGVDESEKFWPHYWGFDESQSTSLDRRWKDIGDQTSERRGNEEDDESFATNSSALHGLRPPFALHEYNDGSEKSAFDMKRGAADALSILRRGFQCPSGTTNCSSIGYPDSCCSSGESCVVIEDTGLGSVGCCPTGSSCGGTITQCAAGDTACPDSLGGGCCISGYSCSGVGCVSNVVVTIISTQTVTASSSTETILVTTTTTSSQVATTTTDTSLQTTLACATNYHACPVDMGGGCCPTDRICTTGLVCPLSPGASSSTTSTQPATESTATASAPARPTSVSDSVSTTTSTPIVSSGTCPTGFYACSAYYAGGCCRTGRNCATTDCPTTASETLVSSGVTIVVPLTGDATTTASGTCATGWSTCAASLGGNCCPTGFACGTESCSSISATSTVVASKEGVVASQGSLGGREGLAGLKMIMLLGTCLLLAL